MEYLTLECSNMNEQLTITFEKNGSRWNCLDAIGNDQYNLSNIRFMSYMTDRDIQQYLYKFYDFVDIV